MRDESNTPSEEDATEFLPDDGSGLFIAKGSARRILLVAFDVTGLTDDEISWLEMEASVQGEESEDYPEQGHPDARAIGGHVVDIEAISPESEFIRRNFETKED